MMEFTDVKASSQPEFLSILHFAYMMIDKTSKNTFLVCLCAFFYWNIFLYAIYKHIHATISNNIHSISMQICNKRADSFLRFFILLIGKRIRLLFECEPMASNIKFHILLTIKSPIVYFFHFICFTVICSVDNHLRSVGCNPWEAIWP